ncbi:helix-turn-helix domain-containing protein [Escherichia coli]|uniref:helix-turn-helix domain-containing protein n=1 Tax=Escherichia coli TaxID=562 RepID=UPI001FCCFFBE|nr:helix-turn-helix domain-containing protein [Escherichia coli]
MPGQPIPSELKEKGLIWLLPPYCWSHRQIARKLKISASVVSKWRCELVEQGLLPENEKITSVNVEDWTPERRFSVVLETATLSGKRKLTAVCSHQTRIGNLDAHLI